MSQQSIEDLTAAFNEVDLARNCVDTTVITISWILRPLVFYKTVSLIAISRILVWRTRLSPTVPALLIAETTLLYSSAPNNSEVLNRTRLD